jgi:hypothetical protein
MEMHQTVLLKKVGKGWEGAIVKENRFENSLGGGTLEEAALPGLAPVLTAEYKEGTVISFDVKVNTPEEIEREKSLEDASKAEQDTNAELVKLEATKALRARVKAAREELRG